MCEEGSWQVCGAGNRTAPKCLNFCTLAWSCPLPAFSPLYPSCVAHPIQQVSISPLTPALVLTTHQRLSVASRGPPLSQVGESRTQNSLRSKSALPSGRQSKKKRPWRSWQEVSKDWPVMSTLVDYSVSTRGHLETCTAII